VITVGVEQTGFVLQAARMKHLDRHRIARVLVGLQIHRPLQRVQGLADQRQGSLKGSQYGQIELPGG